MTRGRDHGAIVRGLYGLIDELLGLDYQLRRATDQQPPPGEGVNWNQRNRQIASLDFDRLAVALGELKGEDYPGELVELVERYTKQHRLTQSEVSRDIARIAWGVVTGEYTPAGAVKLASRLYGSTARVGALEAALSKGTAGTSDEMKATRAYRVLAAGVKPAPYAHGRDDAPPGKERPLGAVLAETDPEALREWATLREQAEREKKSPLQIADELAQKEQRERLSGAGTVATDTRNPANVSKGLASVGSRCPTTDNRPNPGEVSTRRKPSKTK